MVSGWRFLGDWSKAQTFYMISYCKNNFSKYDLSIEHDGTNMLTYWFKFFGTLFRGIVFIEQSLSKSCFTLEGKYTHHNYAFANSAEGDFWKNNGKKSVP